MHRESLTYDRKDLALVTGPKVDWSDLAKHAVAFAAARGGTIDLGIADNADDPIPDQRISTDLCEWVVRRIRENTHQVAVEAQVMTAANGGEYLRLTVPRSQGLPSRSDGKFFLRIDDTSRSIQGEDVQRLAGERSAMPWEAQRSEVDINRADATLVQKLVNRLRASARVHASVKDKPPNEILQHYLLRDGERLTNLGVLCLGSPIERARLGTAPVIQAIAMDETGSKIGKWSWDDHRLPPMDLIDAVWHTIPAFKETYEVPNGLLRQQVPAYDEIVLREVLVNALVHRPYTQRGDIYMNLYPDRLEVVNPGLLPLGVTPQTILHTTVRRNEQLARLFHDLELMEREGTGFDLMYARQLADGRPAPVLKEGPDRVEVTIVRRILKPNMIELMAKADARFQLRQREKIVLGLLALYDGLTARELATHLELTDAEAVKGWLGRLPESGLVGSSGRTKATRYFVTPAILRELEHVGRTTLSRIATHRLDALVVEDLTRYPDSAISDILKRIGKEIGEQALRRSLRRLTSSQAILKSGLGRWTRYRCP